MHLIKVGAHVVNLERLTHAKRMGGSVVLFFPASTGDYVSSMLKIEGDAAEKLWSYLEEKLTCAVD